MDNSIQTQGTQLAEPQWQANLEVELLGHEQADCPVVHRFGPGIYIREVVLPAGIVAIGHTQKSRHFNQMLCGKVAIIEDGKPRVIEAPAFFVGEAGRKAGLILETTVWQNIYPNPDDCRDVDELEDRFLKKSDRWKLSLAEQMELQSAARQSDRNDFAKLLDEYRIDVELMRIQVENEDDQIPMPDEWAPYTAIRDSQIEGKGLFMSWPVDAGQVIAPARIDGMRTPAGRFVNHAEFPNCHFQKYENDDIYLVASKPIRGCSGGSQGEELTVNYRQALALSGIYPKGKQCQQ